MPRTIAPMMIALVRLNGVLRVVAHLLRDFDLRLEQRLAVVCQLLVSGPGLLDQRAFGVVERACLRGEQRFLHEADALRCACARTCSTNLALLVGQLGGIELAPAAP